MVEAQSGSTLSLTEILGQNAGTHRTLWAGVWKPAPEFSTTPTQETLPNMTNNSTCIQQGWTIPTEKDKHRHLYQTRRTSRQTQTRITVLSYWIWPTYPTSNQALPSLNNRWWGMGHFLTNTWATFNFIYILHYYCLFLLNSVFHSTLS